jgi:GH15 family glucan-1,4-alpha-glucosidase
VLPIERYGLVGNGRSAALVGDDGSIDWLCLPDFDHPACFTALLGQPENGRWLLAPEGRFTTSRRYREDTTVLETTFTTASGRVTVADCMPRNAMQTDLVRIVTGEVGSVRMRHEFLVRPDYGATVLPAVREVIADEEVLVVEEAAGAAYVLRGPELPEDTAAMLEVKAGDELVFALGYGATGRPAVLEPDPGGLVVEHAEDEQAWLARAPQELPHADLVKRSLLTLRTLLHAPSGSAVAAPTTSLPEEFGGERNWDYRYCWLRDSALHLGVLADCGYLEEATRWQEWLLRTVGDGHAIQPLYRIGGGRDLTEHDLTHLSGYADSRPVRIGNAAADQTQIDVYGEVIETLTRLREHGVAARPAVWELECHLLDLLTACVNHPDEGIWEMRGPQRHFTHSKVMAWVAFDRGVTSAEKHGLPGPVTEWRAIRDALREEILTRGYDPERNTFRQYYDSDEVDACLLQLPMVGFVAGDDPRMIGTIAAIEQDLFRDGLLLRYRTESGVDGLAGDEHPFVICSFWLVSAYALAGEVAKARALFERLVGLANDLGLLSEEHDKAHDRMAGNFPQAFSHLGLVRAAHHLAEAERGR